MPLRGAPLGWDAAALDDLAGLSLADILAAQATWRARVPRRFRRLLDGGDADPATLVAALEAYLAASERRVTELTQAVTAGRLDVEAWQAELATETVHSALVGLAVGVGGWAGITAADLALLRDGDE